ncbi:MAG: 30S ribosomal protein S18 [bacterium]|nr:30S ribosomal protein S18 [bacterium]
MKECLFCKKNVQDIDFRETAVLRNFISGLGKIRARKYTGVCSTHQRKVARAIKRGRHLGLFSTTSK